MLAIGLFSRSAKEANSYLQPLLILHGHSGGGGGAARH